MATWNSSTVSWEIYGYGHKEQDTIYMGGLVCLKVTSVNDISSCQFDLNIEIPNKGTQALYSKIKLTTLFSSNTYIGAISQNKNLKKLEYVPTGITGYSTTSKWPYKAILKVYSSTGTLLTTLSKSFVAELPENYKPYFYNNQQSFSMENESLGFGYLDIDTVTVSAKISNTWMGSQVKEIVFGAIVDGNEYIFNTELLEEESDYLYIDSHDDIILSNYPAIDLKAISSEYQKIILSGQNRNVEFFIKAVDGRERSTAYTETLFIEDYINPQLSSLKLSRCDLVDGEYVSNASSQSNYLKIEFDYETFQSINQSEDSINVLESLNIQITNKTTKNIISTNIIAIDGEEQTAGHCIVVCNTGIIGEEGYEVEINGEDSIISAFDLTSSQYYTSTSIKASGASLNNFMKWIKNINSKTFTEFILGVKLTLRKAISFKNSARYFNTSDSSRRKREITITLGENNADTAFIIKDEVNNREIFEYDDISNKIKIDGNGADLELHYEEVSITLDTKYTTSQAGYCRYYPSIGAVLCDISLKLTDLNTLTSNSYFATQKVASVDNYKPSHYIILSGAINANRTTTVNTAVQVNASGDILLTCLDISSIDAGDYLRINGFWFV